MQEVKKKLQDLRQQKERLIAQKAESDAAWEGAQARLKQVEGEIEESSSVVLSPSQEQELLQLESRRGHAETLRQELTNLIAEQKVVETSLAAIGELKGKCPTCGQPISQEMKKREMKALRKRLAELEGVMQGTKEELGEYAEMGTALSRLEVHRRALVRRAQLAEEQSKLQKVQRSKSGDLESRMTILAERINKGERVLEKAQQFDSAKDNWERYVREKSSLEARKSALDRLTDFFGPNGAMMGQLSDRIGSFTEDLNRHLAAFGYHCNLALEPFEMRVRATKDSPLGFSLKQLSASEQFRFGVALQIALAQITGLQFVVIDCADILDAERRRMLTCLLVNSALDQAIVLATSQDAAPTNVPSGVRFLDLVPAPGSSKPCSPKEMGAAPAVLKSWNGSSPAGQP